MNPQIAKNALAFLNRVQLQGSEAPQFMLERLTKPEPPKQLEAEKESE